MMVCLQRRVVLPNQQKVRWMHPPENNLCVEENMFVEIRALVSSESTHTRTLQHREHSYSSAGLCIQRLR
jgi:hypothetical protein